MTTTMAENKERVAILAGINEYAGSPLTCCLNDARELGDILTEPQYDFEIELLLDEDATKENIRARLDMALQSDAAFILFYFSGHGIATDIGSYLATFDIAQPDDGIALDYIRKVARARVQQGVSFVVILDCCHSGSASLHLSATPYTPLGREGLVQELPLSGPGRVVLAACGSDQFSFEGKGQYSLFTTHLLEGLLGFAVNSAGEVTITSLYEYIAKKFHGQDIQVPVFSGDLAGNLVLGRGFTPDKKSESDESTLTELEHQAEQHLQNYHTELAHLRQEPEYWRRHGYRQACGSLTTILQWTDRKTNECSELKARTRYRDFMADLRLRRAELCQLSKGTVTFEGEAVTLLGHGNFGAVWKIAPLKSTGTSLAYKVFHAQDLENEDKARRFERGFNAMNRLDHPCIVRVHTLTTCPLGYFMDFIDGPNLRKFVGTLEEPIESVDLLITIATTLNHAHGRGVIHRDLKPENILLSFEEGKWRAHLTDFDLAWFSTASQLTKSALGALYYASPEQINKPGSAIARAKTTDVYSFGQLMFFTFCGKDPSTGDNLPALRSRVRSGWSEQAARELCSLFESCTKFDARERPQEFRVILERLAGVRVRLAGRKDATLAPDTFIRELVFTVVGFQARPPVDSNRFYSLSGGLEIVVDVRMVSDLTARITYDIRAVRPPVIPGADHRKMREILLSQVERAIGEISGASKRAGNQLPFQVYVNHQADLSFEGVRRAAKLLGRVIDAIEAST